MICEIRGEVLPCEYNASILPIKSDTAQCNPASLEFLANGGVGMLLGLEHALFLHLNLPRGRECPQFCKFGDILIELHNKL